MNQLLKATLVLLALPVGALAELNAGDLWREGSTESQGFSRTKLEALREGLAARST
jgi:hypothetical protein